MGRIEKADFRMMLIGTFKYYQQICKGAVVFLLILMIASHCCAVEKRVLTVGINANLPPLSFVSTFQKGVVLRGLYIDVLNQLSNFLHTEFRYVKCNSIATQRQYLREGKIDIIGTAAVSEPSFPPDEFNTVPMGINLNIWLFVHKACKTIVCAKDLHRKRVAIIEGTTFKIKYENLENAIVIPVLSTLEALKMLDRGLVDAFISPSERNASYVIQREGLENVQRVGLALKKLRWGIAVRKSDALLYHRLTDALRRTRDSGVIDRIEEKWNGLTFRKSLFEKYSRLVFTTIGISLLILVFVVTWNRQLKKQVRKITSKLRASESRYRNLIESSPDMMFVINREGSIRRMNKEALSLLPCDRKPKDSSPNLKDILILSDNEKLPPFLETVFSQKKCGKEFRFKDHRLGYREIDIAATLLPSEPGEDQLACLFARDVTHRNRIERDLVQADRMALIGQMAADVAHEINNPIGIVRANIDLILAKGWFTSEAKEFLESCQRNTIRAGEFTKDLLAIARPKTPEMRELNLWLLVNATIDMMRAQLKNIVITKKTTGIPALILGDWNLLQQVLVNLLLNASAAMRGCPNPEIVITCCAPRDAGMVCLKIIDNGVGISKRHLNQVFEPFFTQGKKEGLGLGLFISKRIIENHNGIIYSESEVDKGAQFVIELPLVSEERIAS